MKIKMTTSAVKGKVVFHHSSIYEVGTNIDEETANCYVKANFAVLVKETAEDPKENKATKEPQEKKPRAKKTKVNED